MNERTDRPGEPDGWEFPALPPVAVGPVAGRRPLFAWRGLLIDSARTLQPISVVKQTITLAARFGFNRLHWHLTDDQGWRFEVPAYPRLTEVGARIPRGRFDDYDQLYGDSRERAAGEAPERWTDGHYTDAEIGGVVAHAAAHGIEIVPELDLPGHMMAAIRAYPELGRPEGLPLPEGSMREHMWWPARNDLLWPGEPATAFLEVVLRRVAQLFPGRYVHIGGDECAYLQWASDPQMADHLRERGLSRVEELQAWFMAVATRVLAEHGKQIAVWDEAAELTAEDALVVAWDEERGMDRAMRARQKFVFADARTLYLNRIDPHGSPDQMGMLPGISVTDILTADWPETTSERCIGVQACAWSEFILDGDDLLRMLFPRLLAVAERMWNPRIDVAASLAAIADEYEQLRAVSALTTRRSSDDI